MKKIRLIAISLAGVSALIASTAIVLAGWCWSDPLLGFTAPGMKEAEVNVDVAVPQEQVPNVSQVLIIVRHPANVAPRVKWMDGVLPEVVVFQPTMDPWTPGQPVKLFITVTVFTQQPLASSPTAALAVMSDTLAFPTQYTVTHQRADGVKEVITVAGVSNEAASTKLSLYVHN